MYQNLSTDSSLTDSFDYNKIVLVSEDEESSKEWTHIKPNYTNVEKGMTWSETEESIESN